MKKTNNLIIASIGILKGDISIKTIEKIKETDLILNYACEELYLKKIFPDKKILNINEKIYKINSNSNQIKYIHKYIHKLINNLFKTYSSISFLVQGNPLFFNEFIFQLNSSFGKKIKLEIIPAVSSFDYIVNTIITKINPNLKMYSMISTPSYFISTECLDLFDKDTIIMNFHSIKNVKLKDENKRIINILSKMKNRYLYSIKIDTKNSKEIIKKYIIPNDLKKLIKDIDNETTLYLKAKGG